MEEKTWTIVQFLDDETVEAVPSTWIQGDHCHWPSLPPQKMQLAIRRSEPLNTCWPSHPVKIFRNSTFDEYMKARGKAKVAEVTSDLNSDENCYPQKRKRIQKMLSSSEDSINESLLESAPKIKKYTKTTSKDEIEHEDGTIADLSLKSGNTYCQPQPTEDSQQDEHTNIENILHFDDQQTCINCIKKDKDLKILKEQGHILRGLITDTLKEVQNLKKIVLKGTEEIQKKPPSIFQSMELNFPIRNDEEFQEFESFLQNEEEFNNASRELSKVGGSNTYDLIKRIMQLILSNDQALKYSWLGMKGKRKFRETNLAKLVLRSAEISGLSETQKVSECAMQTWLRRASDRRTTAGKRIQKKF